MISVAILTKNCAETLGATLESCRSFPEVLILDTGSTDETLQIAQTYPNVRIAKQPFEGFGPSKNRAAELASHPWILSIDSDEVLSEELIREIQALSLNPKQLYTLARCNHFRGKWIRCCSGWYPDHIARLYHRQSTHFSPDYVHEKVVGEGLEPIALKGKLLHTPYRSIESFLTKMQIYSTLFAEQYAGKKKSSLFIAVGHALAAFLKNYILKWGFLGGKEGLIISFYNAQCTYYKYLKLAWRNNSL